MKYSLIKKVYPDFGEIETQTIATETTFEPFDPIPNETTAALTTLNTIEPKNTTLDSDVHLDAVNHILNCEECKAVVKKTLKMNDDTVFKQDIIELLLYGLFILLLYILLKN